MTELETVRAQSEAVARYVRAREMPRVQRLEQEVERLRGALSEALALVDEVTSNGRYAAWGSGTHRVVAWQVRARAALTPAEKENER